MRGSSRSAVRPQERTVRTGRTASIGDVAYIVHDAGHNRLDELSTIALDRLD